MLSKILDLYKTQTMDFIHCDSYEEFLHDAAFGKECEIMHALYGIAKKHIQPFANNLSYEEILYQDMDDCWDSEWLNPLIGVPHYHAANLIIPGTDVDSSWMEQVYYGEKPNVVLWGDDDARDDDARDDDARDDDARDDDARDDDARDVGNIEITIKCMFCVKKFGDVSKCYTHTVKECRILMNIRCLACGEKGHTTTYCSSSSSYSSSKFQPTSSYYESREKKCTFCVKKFGDVPKCYTHTVKDCRILKNITCMNCGGKGHTTSYCNSQYKKQNICQPVMSIMDKAGGVIIKS